MPEKCKKSFEDFLKSLGIYKPFITYEKKQNIDEEYKCKSCPWNYFETWEKKEVKKIEDMKGKFFKMPLKRIFFKCKNPEHEYLTCVEKS